MNNGEGTEGMAGTHAHGKQAQAREEAFLSGWLGHMSLRQKIGQMTMAERLSAAPRDVKEYALGAVLAGGGSHPGGNSPRDWLEMNDRYWQAAVADEDALGVPILFGIDAVHGHNNVHGATIFPHNIGIGAAGDLELAALAARVTARELLATGLEWNFAPTLAVVGNSQWGRTYESFGADPKRVAEFGAQYVRALQSEGAMACVKHWAGDGGTQHGMDQGETTLNWEAFEATHVAPYYPALEAGAMSLMVSFNSWNGEKCHGNRFLVTEVLKERLGFEGIVVSDWDGVKYLDEDYGAAARKSVNAGLDMFMVPQDWRDFIETLVAQVEGGRVAMERIDDAVRRILRAKLRYGLFDAPRPAERTAAGAASFGSAAHRKVAKRAARQSLVLLKNDQAALPLAPGRRILVAGKNAHDLGHQCGGWTLSWQGESGNDAVRGTTIWEGIRAIAPNAELSADSSGADADPARHDVAIVVIGEKPYAEGFGDIRAGDAVIAETGSAVEGIVNPLGPYGQSLEHRLTHPEDLACIQRIAGKGIPVVTLLIAGRPLVVNAELAASAAFVAGWLPGSEGDGVAEVLFGRYGFTGRLPMPWPRCADAATAAPPLFPLGYGLHAPGSAGVSPASRNR